MLEIVTLTYICKDDHQNIQVNKLVPTKVEKIRDQNTEFCVWTFIFEAVDKLVLFVFLYTALSKGFNLVYGSPGAYMFVNVCNKNGLKQVCLV